MHTSVEFFMVEKKTEKVLPTRRRNIDTNQFNAWTQNVFVRNKISNKEETGRRKKERGKEEKEKRQLLTS